MLIKVAKENHESYAKIKYGLTWDQVKDCWAANRSPKTGKRVRTSQKSLLEIKCQKVNWAKLQVRGASSGMQQAVQQTVLRPAEYTELIKTIQKLESLLLNKLTEGYEVTRFEYWQAQASSKK